MLNYTSEWAPFPGMGVPRKFRNKNGLKKFMKAVKNVGRLGTLMLYMINGKKCLKNHVHSTITFTLQKRKNHCITYFRITKMSI